jgi:hypothetical protein
MIAADGGKEDLSCVNPAAREHRGVQRHFSERFNTKRILNFLDTEVAVGNRQLEKETLEREEERDKLWGWNEETEWESEYEEEEERREEELMENRMELEDVDVQVFANAVIFTGPQ